MSAGAGAGTPALRLRNVAKTFPGVRALDGVDFEVQPGTVHALLGHNGSGKSTLIKCLAGVYTPDPGAECTVFGRPTALGDAQDAERAGLRFVHQDLGIIPELGAVDNIGFVTGYARGPFGAVNWRRQARHARELLARFGFALDPDMPLAKATPPERAMVAIVRAVSGWRTERGVLVLDEPTAALPAHEVDVLFDLIRTIAARGAAVVIVSHRLDEVMAIADRATVMRDGRKVWDGALSDITLSGLVDLVVGAAESNAEPANRPAQRRVPGGVPALDVRDVHGEYLRGVGFSVAPGEIVGVAGLLGSGREELPYVIAGAQTVGGGTISVGGVTAERLTVGHARHLGVSLVPADRAAEAVFDGFSTTENVSLGALPYIRRKGVFTGRSERRFARHWLNAMHADPRYAPRPVTTLSGGNQQKAVLARALSVRPKVLVLSEPTAGIDIGARRVIYRELRRRADGGLAVVMASSDLEDLLACCDRVIALRDGKVAGAFSGDGITKSALAYAIEGAHDEHA
ncbi:sugar ABC transporter ATP-binding protein [Actinocorallia sp. API 0066]|uniref:sugar ABC transporter ATP-binding protein n=1 Tax=Actinocorallia sp. API 0066 TaxID=2896846 RepID=UPI001E3B843A|nr:sugar ABC transporter ATP-binding protein [Actinocorallia sp. API 0066]MCD0449162.1 sugar ABC transporter ATP-binding protein [Actinocorallia sp. API 0066]